MARPVHFLVQPGDSIRGYDVLKDYDAWVDSWLKIQTIRQRLAPLEKDREAIEKRSSSKADVRRRLKASFER